MPGALTTHRGRSIALPLLVSLGLHGFLGALVAWIAAGTDLSSERPVGIDSVVWESEIPAGNLSLVESMTASRPGKINGATEESSPEASFIQPVRIGDLPAYQEPKEQGPSVSPGIRGHERAAPTNGEAKHSAGTGAAGDGGILPGATGPKKSSFPSAKADQSIVYLIDQSISMGLNGGLETAKREVVLCLDSLPSTARFQVIFYSNHRVEPLKIDGVRGLLPAGEEVKEKAKEAIAHQRARDGTEHLEALLTALRLQPDVIVLVTDADDLSPEVVKKITSLNQQGCAIHAVELTSGGEASGKGVLALLATRNRGTYRRLK
jgi:hypothetical protein